MSVSTVDSHGSLAEQSSGPAAKGQYIAVLTGVRAMAAYMVFLSHDNPFKAVATQGLVQNALFSFVGALAIGVSVFFVLSGFLITLRYEQTTDLSWQWARRYLRNRVARIYPMYFLVTILTLVGTTLNAGYDPSRLWKFYNLKDKIIVVFLNLTLLRGFFDRYVTTMAGQGWSLTAEECFYLSAPFLILGLRQKWQRILFYPALLLGIGLVLTAIGSSFHDQLFGFFGSIKFLLDWTFFGRCLEFLAGMALALYLRRHPQKEAPGFLFTTLGLIWMALCMCGLIYFYRYTPSGELYSGVHDDNAMNIFSYAFFVIKNAILPGGILLLFWGLLYERSWLKSLLQTRLFDLLGKSSYSFYLIHVGVLDFFLDDYISTNILVKFIIINLVAIMLYKFVEHPVHRMLVGKSKK